MIRNLTRLHFIEKTICFDLKNEHVHCCSTILKKNFQIWKESWWMRDFTDQLIQYKNFFLTWNARFSNEFDFETIYFVFRLKISEIKGKFKKKFSIKSFDYHTMYHTKWTIQSKILLNKFCVFHLQNLNSITMFFLFLWFLLSNCESILSYKLICEMILKTVDTKYKIEKFDFDVN